MGCHRRFLGAHCAPHPYSQQDHASSCSGQRPVALSTAAAAANPFHNLQTTANSSRTQRAALCTPLRAARGGGGARRLLTRCPRAGRALVRHALGMGGWSYGHGLQSNRRHSCPTPPRPLNFIQQVCLLRPTHEFRLSKAFLHTASLRRGMTGGGMAHTLSASSTTVGALGRVFSAATPAWRCSRTWRTL